jgi:transcriptional regulator with XRE-family HTH domain
MDISERFKYIMKLNQLSASAFAEEIGVQRSSISHVLSGRNRPSLEFIQKVLNRFPKVDANWLINGSTNMQEKSIKGKREDLNDREQTEEIREGQAKGKRADESLSESIVRSEDPAAYGVKKEIERIVVFYSDQTFKEFESS